MENPEVKPSLQDAAREEQMIGYVMDHNGSSCPNCGNHNLDDDAPWFVDGGVEICVFCETCHASWKEIYKLIGAEILDPGDN